jgi:hypothetical protein
VIKEVKDIIVNFLWDGGSSKIAYKILIQQIENGGLKLLDFEDKVKALKLMWIKRYVKGTDKKWMAATKFFYNTNNLVQYFSFNKGKIKLAHKFYEEIHNFWSELQCFDVTNPEAILNQCIWNNQHITIQNRPFIWEHWVRHGIMYIKDIVGCNGAFLSHNDINDKYHVRCNFLNALQIRQSIPSTWRAVIHNTHVVKHNCPDEPSVMLMGDKGKILNMMYIDCKTMYWMYVQRKKRQPSSIKKWIDDYPKFENADLTLWKNIYHLAFNITRETKLQSFQYRIIHRTITCREKLFQIKLNQSPQCLFCNKVDNIIHFLLLCKKTKEFWQSFFQWWNRLSDLKIPPDCECLEESILFGFQPGGDVFDVLNYCILNAKFFIHRQKLFYENAIDFYDFLCELKYKLEIERSIYSKNSNQECFSKFIFVYGTYSTLYCIVMSFF